jgi:hypothetical protein
VDDTDRGRVTTDPSYTPRPQAWYTRHPDPPWGVTCKDHGQIAAGLDKMVALELADSHAWEVHGVRQPVSPCSSEKVHTAHLDDPKNPTRAWIDCEGETFASVDVGPYLDLQAWFAGQLHDHVGTE